MNQSAISNAPQNEWTLACHVDQLIADAGVAAMVNGKQVAIFYLAKIGRAHV